MRFGLVAIVVAVLAVLPANAGSAEEAAAGSLKKPVCKRAEVNPVTGHVLCVDPLGAPVAPAPKADPCKSGADAPDSSKDAEFTFRPTCTEQREG